MGKKLAEFIVIICISALFCAIANAMDGKHLFVPGLIGGFVLAGLATIGAIISYLPGFNKFPMVFWVTLLGAVVSVPGMPGQAFIMETTGQMSVLATTSPILAYAGLSLGKDLGAFKQLSWRIVPVALAVSAGTFICATALAHFMLHLQGLI